MLQLWRWIQDLFHIDYFQIDVKFCDEHKASISDIDNITISDAQSIQLYARSPHKIQRVTWYVNKRDVLSLTTRNKSVIVTPLKAGSYKIYAIVNVCNKKIAGIVKIKVKSSSAVELNIIPLSIQNKI